MSQVILNVETILDEECWCFDTIFRGIHIFLIFESYEFTTYKSILILYS